MNIFVKIHWKFSPVSGIENDPVVNTIFLSTNTGYLVCSMM